MSISSLPYVKSPLAETPFVPSAGTWMIHDAIASRPYERVLRMHLDAFAESPLTRCILHDLAYPPIPRISPESPIVKGTVSQGLLAERYGVSVPTIKRSMRRLTDAGYVKTRLRRVKHSYDGPQAFWDYHIYKVPDMNPDWVKAQASRG